MSDAEGIYLVSAGYKMVLKSGGERIRNQDLKKVMHKSSQTKNSLKFHVFGWRLLLNRMLTRYQLVNRRILHGGQHRACVF